MEKTENIYLIGFMGCGKSTVSACLHSKYGKKQVEMDERIETEQGKSISEIFAQEGEMYFRGLETDLLNRLSRENNLVVSCGGGVPLRRENVAAMKKNGRVVLLLASPETVYQRVKDFHNRPLLEGNMNVEYIKGLMEARREAYEEAADFSVSTDHKSAEEISGEILRKL